MYPLFENAKICNYLLLRFLLFRQFHDETVVLFLEQVLHRDCPIEAGGIFIPLQTVGGNQY